MIKLQLLPNQEGYEVSDGDEIIETTVGGGSPRRRRDMLNSEYQVTCTFTLNPTEYQYLRAFYNYINKGADGFLMDLIIEDSTLREHVCHIRPGTWKLVKQAGHMFQVKFTIDALPNDDGIDYAAVVAGFAAEVPDALPPAPITWGGGIE